MPNTKRTAAMRRTARKTFGFELRPEQERAIGSVLDGRDTLVVMPTGSGKSAIFQLAGLLLPGPAVVISPLLALQRDQLESLQGTEQVEAAAVNSAARQAEREDALDRFAGGSLRFLYIAPEQFHRADVLERVKAGKPSLFVVDEAHCISEWGDDFRPEYLRLGAVIDELGHPTVLALTATASPRVREEIMERLGMVHPAVLVSGFDRPNIWLGVQRYHDERVKTRELLDCVEHSPGPGIVYVSTRRHAEDIAEALRERNVRARPYHAGMKDAERRETEAAFMEGEIELIVATSAFGMGVDKPDVRFVYHYDVPESVDAYYQEIGRAGRDGQPARARLFYRPEDLAIHHFFAGTGQVSEEQVELVAETVLQSDGTLDASEVREATGLSRSKVTTALTRLEEVGAVEIGADGEVVEGEPLPSEEAAEEAVQRDERHRVADRSRIDMMRGYAEVRDCRREFLLNYFGERYDEPCGRCDNCEAGIVVEEDVDAMPFPLNSRVRHTAFGEGLVQRYEGDAMIVLFDDAGYKSLLIDFVAETGALQAVAG